MTTPPKHIVKTGAVGGTPINVDTKGADVGGDPWRPVKVTLTQNYAATNPPGFPDRPPIGQSAGAAWKPGTINSGTTRYFHACEAQALINAGAATLA